MSAHLEVDVLETPEGQGIRMLIDMMPLGPQALHENARKTLGCSGLSLIGTYEPVTSAAWCRGQSASNLSSLRASGARAARSSSPRCRSSARRPAAALGSRRPTAPAAAGAAATSPCRPPCRWRTARRPWALAFVARRTAGRSARRRAASATAPHRRCPAWTARCRQAARRAWRTARS